MLGDWIDGSRHGRKQDHHKLAHRHERHRDDRRHRSRSGWAGKRRADKWLLACVILLILAIGSSAAWLAQLVFPSPDRFLPILETQGIEGLREEITALWQRLTTKEWRWSSF
jgi:hypothetical protein